jgi:hypothetical protein
MAANHSAGLHPQAERYACADDRSDYPIALALLALELLNIAPQFRDLGLNRRCLFGLVLLNQVVDAENS